MEPRIISMPMKKIIGKRIRMSLIDNKTFELWRSFMPRRKEIQCPITDDLLSIQVYDDLSCFKDFNPNNKFDKWAAVEVSEVKVVPNEMEPFTIPAGLYAVFLHKGAASTGQKTFQYIFNTWLPNSEFILDNRPHFEVLGEKYKNDDPDSEEDIWIPIKPKN